MCDLGIAESVVHLVMQCPAFESRRKNMLEAIYQLDDVVGEKFNEQPGQGLFWLLGKAIEGVPDSTMVQVWLVAAYSIASIYRDVLKSREGIG